MLDGTEIQVDIDSNDTVGDIKTFIRAKGVFQDEADFYFNE